MKRARKSMIHSVLLVTILLVLFPVPVPAAEAGPSASGSRAGKSVRIDFNDVDIGVFIKFISELTGKNFIVDDRVRGKVTVISPSKISLDEAYRVFESVLEVHGFTTVPAGGMVKIVASPDARTKSIETRLRLEAGTASDKVVTQIISLDYADPSEVQKLLAPLASKSSVMLAYPPAGMLIVTDVESNIRRLMRLLEAIDVSGAGREVALIPLAYAYARKLEGIVTAVFASAPKRGRRAAGVDRLKAVSDARTNTLILLAKEDEIHRVRQLAATPDRESPRGKGKIRVYYLENAIAEDLAEVLQNVPTAEAAVAKGGKTRPLTISKGVKITADKATNSLIIIAEKEDYEILDQIIAKLDIPRSMVYIECLIMEVNVDKEFRLGTEWKGFGKTDLDGRSGAIGAGFDAPDTASVAGLMEGALPSGGAVGVLGETLQISGVTFPSLGAVIQAFKKDKDVHIISTPQILTTDNQEAKIYIGKNVPFQTKSTTTNNETYNSYEYKDVGTSLYAVLQSIHKPDINIITIEDPVEYQIPGIGQIQVNPKIGLTFARGLRAIVRQDPDVILVGEIRDRETAEIAVQSALTGHLVFSTLHTNDSAGAMTRLVDIGVEPFLISSAVLAVAAQRLVRRLCPHCRGPARHAAVRCGGPRLDG